MKINKYLHVELLVMQHWHRGAFNQFCNDEERFLVREMMMVVTTVISKENHAQKCICCYFQYDLLFFLVLSFVKLSKIK